MARPIVKQRTRTNFSPTGQRTAPGLDVVAPLDVNARGGEGAAALVKALDLGMDFAVHYGKQVQEKDAAMGAFDATAGVIDEKKMKRRAYEDAYIATKAEADFATKKAELTKWYEENFDHAKGTPQELDEKIVEFYQKNYGHVEDPRIAKIVTPHLERLRAELVGRQTEITRKAVEDEHVANSMAVIEDALNSAQMIDQNVIKDRLAAVLPGGKSQAVRSYAQMVASLAVKRKDEKLIDALVPERWQDGTPGPYSIPEVAQQLNQARYYAQQAREADESRVEREMKLARAQVGDEKRRELMLMAMAGEDIQSLIPSNSYLFSPEDINQIVTFNEKMKNDREAGERGNPIAIANIEYQFFAGTASRKDLLALANSGDLGTGEELRQNMHTLLNAYNDAYEHVQRTKTDSNYRFYAGLINDEVPIVKDMTGEIDPTSVGTHRMALSRFHELAASGKMSAAEAYQAVLKEVPKLKESTRITVDLTAAPSAAELLQGLRAGMLTPELKQKYTPEVILQLLDADQLDEQQANQLIDLYE